MRIELDLTGLPVVRCRFPSEFDEDEVHDFFERYIAFLERGERFVGIWDFTETRIRSTARLRKIGSNFIERLNARPRQLSAAAIIVTPHALWRGAMTAILWVAKPRAPTHVVSSLDEGLEVAQFIASEALL